MVTHTWQIAEPEPSFQVDGTAEVNGSEVLTLMTLLAKLEELGDDATLADLREMLKADVVEAELKREPPPEPPGELHFSSPSPTFTIGDGSGAPTLILNKDASGVGSLTFGGDVTLGSEK